MTKDKEDAMTNHQQTSPRTTALLLRVACFCFMAFLLTPAFAADVASTAADTGAAAGAGADALGLPPCPKEAGENQSLSEDLRGEAKQHFINEVTAYQDAEQQQLAAHAENPRQYADLFNIEGTWCLDSLNLKIGDLRSLLDSAMGAIGNLIKNQINNMINQACNYVNSNIKTALGNLTDAMCIPMDLPSFNLSLDLPSLTRKGCNGVSLSNMTQIQQGSAAPPSFSFPRNYITDPNMPIARFIQGLPDTSGEIGIGGGGVRF